VNVNPTFFSLHQRRMVDDAVSAYVDWREECAGVWDAYARWASAAAEDITGAYRAYLAALDREEAAASAYAGVIDRVAELLPASSSYPLSPGGPA
jgi:hypothetical protein